MLTLAFWCCIVAGIGFIKDGDVGTGFVFLALAVLVWCKWITKEMDKRKEGQ